MDFSVHNIDPSFLYKLYEFVCLWYTQLPSLNHVANVISYIQVTLWNQAQKLGNVLFCEYICMYNIYI